MLIRIIGAIVAVAVVAIVVVALSMWGGIVRVPGPLLVLLVGAREPEHSAMYYEPDTLAYAWATLVPKHGQLREIREIRSGFGEIPGFDDLVDQIERDFAAETGIDVDDDVMSWIGPEISAAILDVNPAAGTATAAATIGVRDKDAAARFILKWLEFTGEGNFDAGSYGDFDTWSNDDLMQAYALTDDWLVFATDEATLRRLLDRIDGEGGASLAEEDNFAEAREAMSERRFHSVYLDYRSAADAVGEFVGGSVPLMPGLVAPAAFAEHTPEWVAISGSWVERGLVIEVVSPIAGDSGLEIADLGDPAALLSEQTLGFMAASFDPDVDHWRVALDDYLLADALPHPMMLDEINSALAAGGPNVGPAFEADATLADALDLGFATAKEFTGIDLERDWFDHLAGEAIFAVHAFEFDAVSEDPAGNAIDAVAMFSYTDEGEPGLDSGMSRIGVLAQNHGGINVADVEVGARNPAQVFDLAPVGIGIDSERKYRPGYVLHDGYLTLGTTVPALEGTVSRQNGVPGLSSEPRYMRAVGHLPEARQLLGYVDLARIVQELGPDALGLDPWQYLILQDGIGVVAFSSTTGADYHRSVVVMTVLPE